MAIIVDTSQLTRNSDVMRSRHTALQIYCCLDTCITREVFDSIYTPKSRESLPYRYSRLVQNPALSMMLRGVCVDHEEATILTFELEAQVRRLEQWWGRLCVAAMDEGVNHRSPVQLQKLFYEALRLPVQRKRNNKGEQVPTTDRNALEKLSEYTIAKPFVNTLLKIRDLGKLIQVLKTGLDRDGRLRTTFSVCGTDTWRWSSYKSPTGDGTNLQNISDRTRRIIISDPGWVLAYPDLEQAESRFVAYISGDPNYIEACESGDVHTSCCRMMWPELVDWTGDNEKDKKLAAAPYYRHFSYRDMMKRGGHASNYMVSPWMLSQHLKIEKSVAEEFQEQYYSAFPYIRDWHHVVKEELLRTGRITNVFGFTRQFFGRRDDNHTLKSAVAQNPQSSIAILLKMGMYAVWQELEVKEGRVQLLLDQHDGMLLQFREGDIAVLDRVRELMTIPVEVKGRTIIVPVDIKVGYCFDKSSLVSISKAKELTRPTSKGILEAKL